MDSNIIDPLDNPEINRVANDFQTHLKISKRLTSALSKKSMERVFDAVMEFPLAASEPKFRNDEEHDLFILALNLLANKNKMMEAVIKNQTENLEKLKQTQEAVNQGESSSPTAAEAN